MTRRLTDAELLVRRTRNATIARSDLLKQALRLRGPGHPCVPANVERAPEGWNS